jgi:hypothetical protein
MARAGEVVGNLSGFPLFTAKPKPNIIAADPWAFLEHFVFDRLDKRKASRASAFIDQAFDFYQAAQNPMIASKPLLYYYSFLNLAKMALLTAGVELPASPVHGVREPGANSRDRSRFEGHKLQLDTPSPRNILPEFAQLFGSSGAVTAGKKKSVRVIDVLGQVPSVHRTFAQVRQAEEILLPLKSIQAVRDGGSIWARVVVEKKHWDHGRKPRAAVGRVRFRSLFTRKQRVSSTASSYDDDVWFETEPVEMSGRRTSTVVNELADKMWRRTFGGLPLSVILTERGYRYYLSNIAAPSYWHPLAATLAVMFYLGSITRYRPYAFDSALEGGYSWVVWEFVATAAPQFIYVLASHIAQTEVVRPYADVRP